MKILQIGRGWFSNGYGGAERYFSEIIKQAAFLKEEVIGGACDIPEFPGIIGDLHLVSLGKNTDNLLKKFFIQRRVIRDALRNNNIDIVVSHYPPSIFGSLNEIGKKPFLCHFHFPGFLLSSINNENRLRVSISKYIENKVYRRADHFIVLSEFYKDILVRTYGVAERKISVIPGGVDAGFFKQNITRSQARLELGLPGERTIILTVRRLVPRMGIENLIIAMQEVVKVYPEVLLIIAGTGPIAEKLDASIKHKGLTKNIIMTGFISEERLPVIYRAADFTVVPTSALEGFGLVIIESLACGTPVLGTPVGAIPEILRKFSESMMFKGSAPKDLAGGILEALSGKRIFPGMQECGDFIALNYAWPVIAKRVTAVYRDLVNRKPC